MLMLSLLFPNVNCLMANSQSYNTNVTYNLVAMCRTNFIPTIFKNAKAGAPGWLRQLNICLQLGS